MPRYARRPVLFSTPVLWFDELYACYKYKIFSIHIQNVLEIVQLKTEISHSFVKIPKLIFKIIFPYYYLFGCGLDIMSCHII